MKHLVYKKNPAYAGFLLAFFTLFFLLRERVLIV